MEQHKKAHKQGSHEQNKHKVEFKKISFSKKIFNEKALIVVLLFIVLFASVYFRLYSANLPITQDWARNTYYGNIKANIAQQISQQYSNLPSAQKNKLVDKQFQKVLSEGGDQLQSQIQSQAAYFKTKMQDDNNNTYLLAIDPYFYLRQTEHYIANKQVGTTYVGGDQPVSESVKLMYPDLDFSKKLDWDGQRMAPIGAPVTVNLHTRIIAFINKLFNLFGKSSLMHSMFYVPVIISALAVLIAFFVGRRIAGTIGGFFGSLLLAIHPAFLNRTMGGFSDTDPYNIFFPLLITWMVIESIHAKELKNKFIFAGLAGLATGIFALVWNWWFIFAILLAGLGIYLLIELIKEYQSTKKIFRKKTVLAEIYNVLAFFVATGIFVSVFKGARAFFGGLLSPFYATQMKAVAIDSVWPNILTTVAELNSASIKTTVSAMGGNFLFLIAIVGLVLASVKLFKKDKPKLQPTLILIAWFIVGIYASTKGVRFNLLLVPAFAIAFGAALGRIYQLIADALKNNKQALRIGAQIAIVLLFAVLLINPIHAANTQAKNEVPSMNDAWYHTLTKIKTESEPNAIINSWWDFGHWFITLANRSATFDGAGQDRHMAYWIGRSLMSNDPKLTTGILRMVDCGNNDAFYQLNAYLNNTITSINTLNAIVVLNKTAAKQKLSALGLSDEEANKVLQYTHCQAPEDYYIVSQDMIGKAGVWAHFGAWDFTKATIYNIAKGDKETYQAIAEISKATGLSDDEASKNYYEATSLESSRAVDSWISPWPNYITTSPVGCAPTTNGTVECSLKQKIAQQNGVTAVISKITIPQNVKETTITIDSINNMGVNVGTQTVQPKKVTVGGVEGYATTTIDNATFPYELTMANINGTLKAILADDAVSDSTFTKLFFFEGVGMPNFKKFSDTTSFTGDRIIVYKADVN